MLGPAWKYAAMNVDYRIEKKEIGFQVQLGKKVRMLGMVLATPRIVTRVSLTRETFNFILLLSICHSVRLNTVVRLLKPARSAYALRIEPRCHVSMHSLNTSSGGCLATEGRD